MENSTGLVCTANKIFKKKITRRCRFNKLYKIR